MSYTSIDLSTWFGRTVYLYVFRAGSTVWRYTSTSRDYTFDGNVYTAVSIRHGDFEVSQDELKSDLQIIVARTVDIVALFSGFPPEHMIPVVVYRTHKGCDEAIVEWRGWVAYCKVVDDEATLSCQSNDIVMSQSGLVRFSRICRHALYSKWCGAVAADYRLRLVGVTNPTATTLTHAGLASQADGWWTGGYAELDTGERRMIVAHSGTTVTINYAFSNALDQSAGIAFYPGCDLTIETCDAKFGRRAAYGGQPSIPLNNPWDAKDKV